VIEQEAAAAAFRSTSFKAKSQKGKWSVVLAKPHEWLDLRVDGEPWCASPGNGRLAGPSFRHRLYGDTNKGGLAIWASDKNRVPRWIDDVFKAMPADANDDAPPTQEELASIRGNDDK
jgi:hypothetical protein